jgi:hypothetical protein
MSHILLKKVQDNLISAPASNYVKFFSNDSDGGLLYYMNSSGVATPIGDGTYNPVIDTTYSNLYSLYSSNGFATGSYYYINDFQSIYEQPDFYFDDKPKTVLSLTSSTSYPIVVLATSKNTLAVDAYQPDYPKDKIKYDFTWNETEFGNPAKGRITERIDVDGNRTDYDHRTIKFKRYQNYERDIQLNGFINSWDCISGTVSGTSTTFMSELSIGDIIILDSHSAWGGDKSYTIGLKVKTKVNDTTITVEVDSLYTGGVPSTVLLNNVVTQIIPTTNYTFGSKLYTFWSTIPGDFTSYKEVYFSQFDDGDFDNLYTFHVGGTSVNNYIGNYSQKYLSGSYNNTLILSNNVFTHTSSSYNKLEGTCYNNHFEGNALNNTISNDFNNNIIIGDFNNNIIIGPFYNNFIGDMSNNSFFNQFYHNFTEISGNFKYNSIKCEVGYFGLLSPVVTSPSHIYGTYSCDIILTSGLDVKLSYYNGSNALTVVDITA